MLTVNRKNQQQNGHNRLEIISLSEDDLRPNHVEGYSRMLYLHFSHSQEQNALHRGLLDAFCYFGGAPNEIVVDNMLTAVTEQVGSIIRFNEAFVEFFSAFGIRPHACTIRSLHEKGKVENSINYLHNNFWPLRNFTDLEDVANIRKHATTDKRPIDLLHGYGTNMVTPQ